MAIENFLGLGLSAFNAINSSSNLRDARNLGYANLFEQRRQAREREKLAKSTRTDAYGNTIRYIPGRGFVTETTPLTQAILNAQQKEQLAGFREDAPRARQAAERIDKRSRQAGELFDERFNEFRHKRRRTREEYEAEAIRDALDARRGRSRNDEALNALTRAALRQNNSAIIPNLVRNARNTATDSPTLAEAIANAKRQGRQQYLTETNAENSVDFNELGQLRSIADAFVGPNLNYNNENAALSGRQDNALNTLIQANLANSQATSAASKNAQQLAGQSVDLSPIVQSLQALASGNKNSVGNKQEEDLFSAFLGNGKNGIGAFATF
jgi:hypothetical protein